MAAGLILISLTDARADDADSLVGSHWWGLKPGAGSFWDGIDDAPAQMLDSTNRGAWDVEVVNTHGPAFQQALFYEPLYNALPDKGVSTVTRIEYEYGKTVPSSTTIDTNTWATTHVAPLVSTLKNGGHLWQLGNEANLLGEGNGWDANQITPTGYANVYNAVRSAIQNNAQPSQLGAHRVLVAPVSPGGVAGDRWKAGVDWLSETIDAIGAANIDGFALHSYGGGPTTADALRDFRRGLAEQIAIVDAKGLTDVPLYITEWNRYANPNAPDASDQEALAADFAREAMKFVNEWNNRPGNHNVVSMSWFVNDPGGAQDGTGPWDGYGIEYWKSHGNPVGTAGDLYTAFQQTAQLGYKAGLSGSRALPDGISLFDDFEGASGRGSGGRFDKSINFSPQTTGLRIGQPTGPNSFTVVTADDSFTHGFGQKLGIFDNESDPLGWTVRHSSGSGSAGTNAPIALTAGDDGFVGFWLRVFTSSGDVNSLTAALILDSGAGGGDATDAGVARVVNADGEWHYYEWGVDVATDWTIWRDHAGNRITGDGVIASSGNVTVDSIWLTGADGVNVEYFFDSVMHNRNGSLAVMVPEPAAITVLIGGAGLALRKPRR